MKSLLCIAGMSALALVSGSAFAQTCGTPGSFSAGSNPTASGTTCGLADSITDICVNSVPTTGPEAVYTFTTPASGTLATQISLNYTTGDLVGFLLSGSCTGGATCATDTGDSAGVGPGTETANVALAFNTQYWFVVTSAAAAPNNCGAFTLTANGTLPVQLQGFSVE